MIICCADDMTLLGRCNQGRGSRHSPQADKTDAEGNARVCQTGGIRRGKCLDTSPIKRSCTLSDKAGTHLPQGLGLRRSFAQCPINLSR